jgi:hypothetical protein
MPKTDYSDPEIAFPRLEVRIQKTDHDAYWLTIWLHKEAAAGGQRVVNGKFAGSFRDAHERVSKCADENGADVGPDDFTIDWPEADR